MALKKNYAIWNNKGGVGKSTITYHLATRYAQIHPTEDVLVIDMCPQANISMLLLGGAQGDQNVMSHMSTSPISKTIVGYLGEALSKGQGASPNTMSYPIQVSKENPNMPGNLYLLCGDGNLEIMAPALQYYANQPQVLQGQVSSWVWVHHLVRNLIFEFAQAKAPRDVTVFIDTNPAFSIYTEMAICAAENLLCPVNADDSSRFAAQSLMALLHGSNPAHPLFSQYSFSTKAKQEGINLPKIHLIVGNRMTQHDGAAAAYQAMSDATANTMYKEYIQHPVYFTSRSKSITSSAEFIAEYSQLLRDFNTAGVVSTYLGQLLSQMRQGAYTVHGAKVQVKSERIAECQAAVDELLNRI